MTDSILTRGRRVFWRYLYDRSLQIAPGRLEYTQTPKTTNGRAGGKIESLASKVKMASKTLYLPSNTISPKKVDETMGKTCLLLLTIQRSIIAGNARGVILSIVSDEMIRQTAHSLSLYLQALAMLVRSHGDVGMYLMIEIGEKAFRK